MINLVCFREKKETKTFIPFVQLVNQLIYRVVIANVSDNTQGKSEECGEKYFDWNQMQIHTQKEYIWN